MHSQHSPVRADQRVPNQWILATARSGWWRVLPICRTPARLILVLALGCALVSNASAEALASASGQLETIFVSAPEAIAVSPVSETHYLLDAATLDRIAPRDIADVARRLPSAHVPTNSRGETLLYLRGAGERQVAVFFDGALLNVPWDNRADLAILPGAIIGRAVTASGTLSPQYGVNALGALALFARDPEAGERGGTARIGLGTEGARSAGLEAAGEAGSVGWTGALGHSRRDGQALSSRVDLPFHQTSTRLRTNTDERRDTALLRGRWQGEGRSLAATFLVNDVERGIAPESDRASGSRFWRYPVSRLGMAILSGAADLSEASDLSGSAWLQSADQRIDAYTDNRYLTVASQEISDDQTLGLRAIHRWRGEGMMLATSFNLLGSEHRQRDQSRAAGAPRAPTLRYSQVSGSFGIDGERDLGSRCAAEAGVGIDMANYPGTADKPDYDRQQEPTWRLGLACATDSDLRWRAALGQKSRFPTMRELFGTALNRFLLNPDLRAESVRTAELGVERRGDGWEGSAILFTQQVDDAIGERRVGQLRQRVNIAGSEIVGLELGSRWEIDPAWSVGASATWIEGRRMGFSGVERNLVERPDALISGLVEYRGDAWQATAELQHAGRAWSLDAAGDFVALPRSTQLHLHFSGPFGESMQWELHGLNLTDARVIPQEGLPAPGRSLEARLAWRW